MFNDFVGVNFLSGFDEDDMEKPKFNFSAPSDKVPFCLNDNVQVGITDFYVIYGLAGFVQNALCEVGCAEKLIQPICRWTGYY